MAISRFTDNDDARIHYLDSGGEDRGAPIVFVPGMTDIADDYTAVLPVFGRRTVVVELRGHGRSGSPQRGYDLATLSTDVGAVIDAVTDGPVHVVTFSRGTSAAVAWTLGHPDRVRSLAIGDYVPEEKVLPNGAADTLLSGRWRGSPVSERLDVAAATKTFQAARDQSFWEELAQLGLPLLVVRSGDSALVGTREWARYGSLFPQAQLVECHDSPHDIFRPDRGRYPRLVQQHVEQSETSRFSRRLGPRP
jgi:pimeloyl-ACP methyl ester carboxylesterase